MPNFVDKKWYSGSLQLRGHVDSDQQGGMEAMHKCLIQHGKQRVIQINLVDTNNLITLQYLRRGRVKVFGRLVDLSSSVSSNLTVSSRPPYYLETEQIQVIEEESTHDRMVTTGGDDVDCRNGIGSSNNMTFVGKLISLGPVLSKPPQPNCSLYRDEATGTRAGNIYIVVVVVVDAVAIDVAIVD